MNVLLRMMALFASLFATSLSFAVIYPYKALKPGCIQLMSMV